MTHDLLADQLMTGSFFEALIPLLRRRNAERTLSPGKLGVLRHLAEQGRATTSELAAIIQVSPQAISLAARELERLQLVMRVPDAEDRRRIWIEITEVGRQKLAQELAAGEGWLDQAIREKLTKDERETLHAAIVILWKLGLEVSVD